MGAHRYMHLPSRGCTQPHSPADPAPPAPWPTPPPPPLGEPRHNLWFRLHDLQPRKSRTGKAVTGLPETGTTRGGEKYKVTKRLEDWLIASHLVMHPEMTEAEVVDELKKLFRNNGGWCNQTGWDSGDFKIAALCSGGATLVATVPGPTPTIVKGRGNQYLEVYAMDPNAPPAVPNSLEQLRQQLQDGMCFFPMTALADRSNHFPNFGGRCLVPLLGKGGVQYVLWTNTVRPDGIGFQKVAHVLQPALPERTDVTAGLIP